MNRVNLIYIPRNHRVEEALAAAQEHDDLAPFERLLDAASDPFIEREGREAFVAPAPAEFGPYATFCGT